MALKGTQAKEEIVKKILETFSGSFKYDKEIRIPWTEDGEQIQIKLTLTAAKAMVEQGGDTAIPAATPSQVTSSATQEVFTPSNSESVEVSAEEKENLSKLLRSLGL